MNKLALFDIDKTLVKSSLAHKASFSAAFKKIFVVDTNIDIINHCGMTDQQIIADVLKNNGLDDETIKSKMKECMAAMVDAYERMNDEIILFDDTKATLEGLKGKNYVLGLVTGNLEPIGWSKIKKAGIAEYFSVGGFGSDNASRTELVKIAAGRAKDKFRIDFEDIWLIGDAPQDIKAGKEAGVKTIGVTTGIYQKDDLINAGANNVAANLIEVLEII